MPLSHLAITKALPKAKPFKLSDGGGLHLLIEPHGSKKWRFRYHFGGREKMIALGTYPATSLADARTRRDQARTLIEKGIDPSDQRKEDKAVKAALEENTFGRIAAEVIANKEANDAAASTMEKNRWLLENLAKPLAERPISAITAAEILALLKRIEATGRRETARRLRGLIGSVFKYAIVTQRATTDPTIAIHGALLAPKVKHRAAILDEKELGGLIRAIDKYDGWITVRLALRFTALTFARPGEVRGAMRKEFDRTNAVWSISAERTKMRRPHQIPLSPQALAVLEEIWPISDYNEFVFPSIRSLRRPLSDNAMNAALRRMGYTKDDVSAHGFRSSASTILNERGYNRDVIEAALGHQDDNEIRRAYNRGSYWPQRVQLMNDWAMLLDKFAAS